MVVPRKPHPYEVSEIIASGVEVDNKGPAPENAGPPPPTIGPVGVWEKPLICH